jgi:hypothetical protein
MEVSSHALAQDRVRGILFRRAVFTNLTQDHFDFHGGFEDYCRAKKRLFTEYLAADGVGIVNLDSPYGLRLLREWDGPRVTFSRGETPEGRAADVALVRQELSLEGTHLILRQAGREFEIRSRLVGTLNVENLLAASAFGLSLGYDPALLASGMAGPPNRRPRASPSPRGPPPARAKGAAKPRRASSCSGVVRAANVPAPFRRRLIGRRRGRSTCTCSGTFSLSPSPPAASPTRSTPSSRSWPGIRVTR